MHRLRPASFVRAASFPIEDFFLLFRRNDSQGIIQSVKHIHQTDVQNHFSGGDAQRHVGASL
jgi:hypothetical protein